MTIPKYRCHKVVEAFKIAVIRPESPTPDFPVVATLQSFDGLTAFADQAYMDKHKPEIGGYWVRYDSGYASFSPAGAFEDGYELLENGLAPRKAFRVRYRFAGDQRCRIIPAHDLADAILKVQAKCPNAEFEAGEQVGEML